METNKEKHPSYGMLQFCRTTGGTAALFGSSIQHRDTIKMYLREGSVERLLNADYYSGDGLIAEVEMSYSQFAEAITAMNTGTGVPVTIRWLKNIGPIESCPFVDKRKQYEDEFKSNLKKANEETESLIDTLRTMFETKKSFNKTDKELVMRTLLNISRNINENNAFLYKQFNEQMDKTTTEAKGEIEAFMQNKRNSIAQSKLVEKREELLNQKSPVAIE